MAIVTDKVGDLASPFSRPPSLKRNGHGYIMDFPTLLLLRDPEAPRLGSAGLGSASRSIFSSCFSFVLRETALL